MKRIAILCSGGDSQGMNTSIKTIVDMCSIYNIEVLGAWYGYKGLLEGNMHPLKPKDVVNIANLGGCYLRVARAPEFHSKEGVKKAAQVIRDNNIDCVVAIGGNGTFRGCMELIKEGINVIGIPGTIDNDLFYTERTLGFDTAVNNAVRAIDDIRQTMEANNRACVIEVMGRECGDIALSVAVAVQAHSVAVVEADSTIAGIVSDVKKCLEQGATKAPIVVISEACHFSIEDVQAALEKELNIDTRGMNLSYLLRGGAPSVEDRKLATSLGIMAVELVNKNKFNVALGVYNNRYFSLDFKKAVAVEQEFDFKLLQQLRELYRLN